MNKVQKIEEKYADYLTGDWSWYGFVDLMRKEDLEYLIEAAKKYESLTEKD